jgi:hypothetical protein
VFGRDFAGGHGVRKFHPANCISIFSYFYLMIRSLITPQSTDLHIATPDEYVGKKLEVLVFPFDEPKEISTTTQNTMGQFWGVISNKTTEEMHQHISHSREEWE